MLAVVSEHLVAIGVLVVAGFIAIGVVLTPIAERFRIPPTVALVFVGFLVSEIDQSTTLPDLDLGGDTFNLIVQFFLLPTLVFAAAREMSTRRFLTDLVPILTLAIPAFVVSMFVVGLVLQFLPSLTVMSAFVFAALITATDPVAVVATFKRVGVPERLATLVQGESVMNDGIAIVFYSIFVVAATTPGSLDIREGFIEFIVVFFGGAAVGALIGVAASIALYRLDMLAAAALTIAVAYGSFAVAEFFDLSGVIATLASALVLGAATPTVATPKQRQVLDGLWESADFVANALLFLLLGFEVDVALIGQEWEAILAAIVVVYIARAIGVVPVLTATCRIFRLPPVSARFQAVLVWGGLRGGVAVALALSTTDALPGRDTIIAMTFGVVLATLLVNSTTIPALIRRLGLDRPTRVEAAMGTVTTMMSVRAARDRMNELDLRDLIVDGHLSALDLQASRTLADLQLGDQEWVRVIQASGIAYARGVIQTLIDEGLIWGPQARTMLGNLGAEGEALRADDPRLRSSTVLRHLLTLEVFLTRFQRGQRQDAVLTSFAVAHAREVANIAALDHLQRLQNAPAVSDSLLIEASARFALTRNVARQNLRNLAIAHPERTDVARHLQAWNVTRVTAIATADQLAETGVVADRSSRLAIDEIAAAYEQGVQRDIEESGVMPLISRPRRR